jgi:hypothetical protein
MSDGYRVSQALHLKIAGFTEWWFAEEKKKGYNGAEGREKRERQREGF